MPDLAGIREATAADIDALAAIELAAVSRTRDDWIDMVEKARSDDRLLLVADLAGAIAGFAQTHFLAEHPIDAAPAGFYLTGVTVIPGYRRAGLGHAFTKRRLEWIRERANEAWYFANANNEASIQLHTAFGFIEMSRAGHIHGVEFEGGEGILFRADASA
jgi:phosphinothricin acetyltransferase